ncbi:hypothetical protein CWI85_16250, partial [Streptomyces albidoflavus]
MRGAPPQARRGKPHGRVHRHDQPLPHRRLHRGPRRRPGLLGPGPDRRHRRRRLRGRRRSRRSRPRR